MIKKITMLIFLILSLASISLGQMASLENKTAYPNTATSVAINIDNFTNINSVTFQISYNPEVLDFIGISNLSLPGMIANTAGSVISITWASTTSFSPAGILCNVNFFYKGTSCPVAFLPGCEVTQGAVPLFVGYTNGAVSPACQTSDAHAEISDVVCATGDFVSVPVNFSNFSNVGAFTQYIAYDETRFTFISLTTGGNFAGTTYNNSNGTIAITWVAPSSSSGGLNLNTIPASSNLLKLNFQCNLPGTGTIDFGPGCAFTAGAIPYPNINVCYGGGNVSQTPTSQTAVLGSLTGVIQGDEIEIPLNLSITESISDFTLQFQFNSPVLAYTGIEAVDPLSGSAVASSVGNILTIVYTNVNPAVIPQGTFLKLKFHYYGIGTGLVGFTGMSQFTNNLLQPVNVGFTNATVAPGVYPPNATVSLGSVSASFNQIIDVPITIDGGSANPLGAATMFIGFDASEMSFIGAIDNVYGATVNAVSNQVNIAWSDATGVALSGTFMNLKFMYHGSGGYSCGSELFFKNDELTLQPCELGNVAASFIPSNWINGGVNLNLTNPVIAGPANPTVGSSVAYSTEASMFNYVWTVVGGIITSGNNTNAITVTWGAAGSGSVSVNYHTTGGCPLSAIKPVTILTGTPTTNVEGYLTYDNINSQGINGVNISLINSLGIQVGSSVITTTNNGSGYYIFSNVPQDSYTMEVNTAASWAGVPYVSATDALIDELHTAGILNPLLTGIRFKAANVNGGATVNATDALFIKKRIIGEISSFPAGDWVFDNEVINAYSSPNTIYNFKGLCTGDVNGSYNPVGGFKNTKSLFIDNAAIVSAVANESFTYNIISGVNVELGALTMYLTYDQNLVEILQINSKLQGLESSFSNGRINLAWSSISAQNIIEDEILFSIQVRLKDEQILPIALFNVINGYEFANQLAEIHPEFGLKMAQVTSAQHSVNFAAVPNPFKQVTSIAANLPFEGYLKIVVTNLVGKEICILADKMVNSGSYSVNFDASRYNLTPGVYLAKIEYGTSSNKYSDVLKLVLIK